MASEYTQMPYTPRNPHHKLALTILYGHIVLSIRNSWRYADFFKDCQNFFINMPFE
jgi:hypothetical protein